MSTFDKQIEPYQVLRECRPFLCWKNKKLYRLKLWVVVTIPVVKDKTWSVENFYANLGYFYKTNSFMEALRVLFNFPVREKKVYSKKIKETFLKR